MSIVVNTPSGNIGRALVQRLLDARQQVVLISRNPDKVAEFVKQGARVVEGSIDDAAVLARALQGAKALFWLTPPAFRPDFREWTQQTARTAADAAKKAGVERVVVLSSVGAQNGPGTGPVSVLLGVEEAFKAAVPNVTILRPGFFMENLFNSVGTLAKAGALFMPLPADKRFPMVATEDIGAKAAEVLLDGKWTGHRYVGVHGPEDLTYTQAAEILTEALGRPVKYVQVTLDDARQGLAGAGLPDFVVDLFVEMYGAIRDGRMTAAEPRSKETTTPTTLAQFARTALKPAVERAS